MSSSTFIAIAGNPNSGKTTAFNKYTGARQHVGNYPGITVEQKTGTAHVDGKAVPLTDLPGTYSLTAYSQEEVVARRVLAEERPGAVLDVINAGVLERNLYLTVQLLEMGVPVVLALNMMDEVKAKGITINVDRLEELMGVTVALTVAKTGEGLDDALRSCLSLAEERRGQPWKPLEISYGPDIDAALKEMMPAIEKADFLTQKYPSRWIALKYLERDEDIMEQGRRAMPEISAVLQSTADKVEEHLKVTTGSYPEAVIADYRYGYIASLLRQGVLTGAEELKTRIEYSDHMDVVLTNRFFGPLILLAVLYVIYWGTFMLGEYPAGWLEAGFSWLSEFAEANMSDGLLKSLVISGIIDGVGGVLGFVPLIMIMFLFIAFLEDSGYMARVAYMMDRIFRFFGLHGASVMPFIVSGGIAGGCAVPGVMATRTLRSPKERLATMLTAPLMTCGAKLPVFLLIVGIFFSSHQALVMFLITLTAWLSALLVARLLRSTLIKGESTPFVMELPPYRMPTLQGVLIHTWERTWQYIKKAGTIILAISVLLWAAMTFPGLSEEQEQQFEAQKAPLEEALAELPSGKLAAEVEDLKKSIEGLPETDPKVLEIKPVLEEKEAQLEAMPAVQLKAEIESLTKELEELETAPKVEGLKEQLAAHKEALEQLPPDGPAAKTLAGEVEKIQAELDTTPMGKLEAHLDSLREQLDATSEKQLEDKIAEVENESSAAALRNSYAGRVGIALEPISKFAGFDWRTNIALVGGIAAKEVVVATLGTAYSLGEVDEEDSESTLADRIKADPHWTLAAAVAFLLFTLLYSPCFVTLAVIKTESGEWKWMWFSLVFNLLLAYGVAVAAYQLLTNL